MRLRILGWSARGLRLLDHEVNLRDPAAHAAKPALIQMPHGSGMTSCAKLLQAVLSGSALRWQPDQVAAWRSFSTPADIGRFALYLDLAGDPLTVELLLDFQQQTAHYQTTFGEAIQEGFRIPAIMSLPVWRLSDLLVFESEDYAHLLFSSGYNALDRLNVLVSSGDRRVDVLQEANRLMAEACPRHGRAVLRYDKSCVVIGNAASRRDFVCSICLSGYRF